MRFSSPAFVKSLNTTALVAALGLSGHPFAQQEPTRPDFSRAQYEAVLTPLANSEVTGRVVFARTGTFVMIGASINGLKKGKHGLHVHEGKSCQEHAGHFNPRSVPHGSPDQPPELRHVGDLGNALAAESGSARYSRIDPLIQVDGPQSIVGRALFVHAGEDDYLSQPSGNSGTPVACGIITELPVAQTRQ